MQSHGFQQKEKAVGEESTHGFEILRIGNLIPLAVDTPLHGYTTTSTSYCDTLVC